MSAETVFTLDAGVWYEWHNGSHDMMNFTAYDYTLRDIEKEWKKATLDTIRHFPSDQPYLGLYDFSHVTVASAHLRQWSQHIIALSNYFEGEYAVVVSIRLFERVIELIHQQHEQMDSTALHASVFSSKAKAIAYLQQAKAQRS